MLYTFRSLHIHHSYYLSFSYCLSTQWHSLSRNPLPRSEFKFPHGYPTTKLFVDNSGFTRFSFCQIRHLGLGSPITPAHLWVMTNIHALSLCMTYVQCLVVFHHPYSTVIFTMLIEVHLSLALPAFLSPPPNTKQMLDTDEMAKLGFTYHATHPTVTGDAVSRENNPHNKVNNILIVVLT